MISVVSKRNEELFQSYLEGKAVEAESVLKKKKKVLWKSLRPHIEFRMDSANPEEVSELVEKLEKDEIPKANGDKYSYFTKIEYLKLLKGIYRYIDGETNDSDIDVEKIMDELHLSNKNPKPREPNFGNLPTPSQVREVAKQGDTLDQKLMVVLHYLTGARVGELFKTRNTDALKWSDIKMNGNYQGIPRAEISIETGMSDRQILILEGTQLLKEHQKKRNPEPEEAVFLNQHGNPISTRTARQRLQRMVKDAGLDHLESTPHKFYRKARAYELAEGLTQTQLESYMGWSKGSEVVSHLIAKKKDTSESYEECELEETTQKTFLPQKCECGEINNCLQDKCVSCGSELGDNSE